MHNKGNYSSRRIFTKTDLLTIKELLSKNKTPKEMYQYLASKGDRYALFAGIYGVENTSWGRNTLFFSKVDLDFEYDDRDAEIKKDINFAKVDINLAQEYVNLLEKKLADSNSDWVEITDVDVNELTEIYNNALINHDFNIENWYLHTVLENLSKEERQAFWQHRLNSSVEFKDQINHHYKLFDMMIKKYIQTNKNEKIRDWLENNFYLSRFPKIDSSLMERYCDIVGEDTNIGKLVEEIYNSFETESIVLGEVMTFEFEYVDPDNLIKESTIKLIKNDNSEQVLFWNTKEEKVRFLIEEVNENRRGRRRKRDLSFEVTSKEKFEIGEKDIIETCKKFREEKSPLVVYKFLASKGEEYAETPIGLIKGTSYSGIMATNYLKDAARFYQKDLDNEGIFNVQYNIADETCNSLIKKLKDNKTDRLTAKFTADEIWQIHIDGLEKCGLPADTWTMHTPFLILPEAKRNEVYQEMLNSSGNRQREVEFGIHLIDKVTLEVIENPTQEKIRLFTQWARRMISADNFQETVGVFGEYLTDKGLTFLEYIEGRVKILAENASTGNPLIDALIKPVITNKSEEVTAIVTPHPHNMVDKSITDFNHPRMPVEREIAPRTMDLLDMAKIGNQPTNPYINRPSVVLPETPGFDRFPANPPSFDRTIGLLADGMSSTGYGRIGSFDSHFSVPRAPQIPEFNYVGGYPSFSSRMTF